MKEGEDEPAAPLRRPLSQIRRIFLLHAPAQMRIAPAPYDAGACFSRVWRGGSAGVAELVDALVLGTSGESRGGSSPSARTTSGFRERGGRHKASGFDTIKTRLFGGSER